jgi:lipoic acid synthetase
MLMGDTCTRGCRFCNVKTGNPHGWLDEEEPQKVAQMVAQGAWQYVVLTVVNRDDLPDAGAGHIVRVLEAIREASPSTVIETLLPDFNGQVTQFQQIQATSPTPPEVIAHNMETVERLTPLVRDRRATYAQSLALLQWFSDHRIGKQLVKTSLMVGLGETDIELDQTLEALRVAGVDIVTFGQYLQPTPKHLPVVTYQPPEWFAHWETRAKEVFGFKGVFAGSFVRSSYKAGALYQEVFARRG